MTAVQTRSLREEQLDRTRERILAAAAEMLATESLTELTVPAVAERAGMSVRTVYRHFATKETLVDAIAEVGYERTRKAFPRGSTQLADLTRLLPHLWSELLEHSDFVRTQSMTPSGREVRKVRSKRRVSEISGVLDPELPDLSASDRRRLAVALSWLMSSTSLFELTDALELPVDDAAGLAVWVSEAAIERARREGRVAR